MCLLSMLSMSLHYQYKTMKHVHFFFNLKYGLQLEKDANMLNASGLCGPIDEGYASTTCPLNSPTLSLAVWKRSCTAVKIN